MAIGSGNPTMSGWGHNNELWWVLRGRTDRGPQAQADLGVWLADLATRVSMPSWIAATIGQIGRRIVPQEVDGTHADVRVLHNLDRPLIDQLPTGSVDELRLAAPFFDPSGQAVRAVVDRFRPRSLTVGLQENLGSYEGRTLVDAAARVERVEFRSLDEGRTMHAKLVEWVAQDGRRTVLVGSANITTPALLRTIAGGNCELARAVPGGGQPVSAVGVADAGRRGGARNLGSGGPGRRTEPASPRVSPARRRSGDRVRRAPRRRRDRRDLGRRIAGIVGPEGDGARLAYRRRPYDECAVHRPGGDRRRRPARRDDQRHPHGIGPGLRDGHDALSPADRRR